MFPVQSNQLLPSEEYTLRTTDLIPFKKNDERKFPKREICSQVLKECGFSPALADEKFDRSGGNGTTSYTADGKYAIKRGCDEEARVLDRNEIFVLSNAVKLIKSSMPKGFNMNLPIKLFQIVDKDTAGYAKCNIQIFPKIRTKPELHCVGNVIESIVAKGQVDRLAVIYALGKTLAKFHQTHGVKRSGRFNIGLQHGDFNAGNILINEALNNGKISFTLIDNADFRANGRLISDLVYFVYFNSIVVAPDFAPNQTERVLRMEQVIQEFYRGYISKAHTDICAAMKKHIFDSNKILESASEKGAYSKRFLNTAIWYTTFEPAQKKAFDLAYSVRILKPGKELEDKTNSNNNNDNNLIENVQDVIKKHGLTVEASSLDFSGFTNLKYVDALATFSKLENLNLANTKVTAVFTLQILTQLKRLDVSHIGELEDISPLAKLNNLERLNLRKTKVAAIEPLKALTALTKLNLSNTEVVWVGPLSKLTSLIELNLSQSKVDDIHSELHLLTALQNLKILNLKGTKVTANFVSGNLKSLLSHCTINLDNVEVDQ